MGLVPLMLKYIGRPMCICGSLLVLALFYCATTMYTYTPYSKTGGVVACICLVLTQNATIISCLLIIETFPTRVRNTAVGICKATGTTIIILNTVIKEFTGANDAMGTYGWTIYATLMLVAAFICVFVSDTGNVPLPDTELQAIIHF